MYIPGFLQDQTGLLLQDDNTLSREGSEEAHFDLNQLQEQFLCKMRLFTPPTPPIAPVMLNAAQRSEASYAIEYQSSTKLVISSISNEAQRSEASFAIEYQSYGILYVNQKSLFSIR